jgi:UDP-glucose:(heptosyl)LPS alpha-1,3-glucosyltransferase
MRIIFVLQKYSAYGGAELLLERTMAALIARGYEVAILSEQWPSSDNGIEIIPCPTPSAPRAFKQALFARAAERAFRQHEGALIQANQPIPGCNILRTSGGVHAAYLRQRALVDGPLKRAWTKVSLFHRNALRLERETFSDRRLGAVIANSAMVKDEVIEFYRLPPERVHHIPNGVDPVRFRPQLRDEFRHTMRAKYGVDDKTPVVLLIGSGYRRKGVSEAIKAVAASRSKPHLWIVGRDSRPAKFMAEAEQNGISDRFRIFGPQPDPRPWYGAADILALPSWYEPFGTVVLEAAASGLPSVVSRSCGSREVIEKFDPRLVYPVGDTQALAVAIDRAIELASLSETRMEIRRLAKNYGMDAMVKRMVALYDGFTDFHS